MAESQPCTCTDLVIAKRNFNRIQTDTAKAGFLEGIAAGKVKYLQKGFERGYYQANFVGLSWGQLMGEISCLKIYAEQKENIPKEVRSKLEALYTRAKDEKQQCLKTSLTENLQLLTDDSTETYLCRSVQHDTVSQLLETHRHSSLPPPLLQLRQQLDKFRIDILKSSSCQT